MNFQDVEQRFHQLRQQRDAGTLTADDFDRQREELKAQDANGQWWTKGQAGDWYVHNGSAWIPGAPPDQRVPQQQYGQSPQQYQQYPSYPHQPPQTAGGTSPNMWIGLGIGAAVLSLIILPIVFGPLGAFFGYRAKQAGAESAGIAVMIAGIVCTVIGSIVGFIVLSNM